MVKIRNDSYGVFYFKKEDIESIRYQAGFIGISLKSGTDIVKYYEEIGEKERRKVVERFIRRHLNG
jgi:hypothetical protein